MGSKFLLEKYELRGKLEGHSGCVNSVLYSDGARFIYTGSDDTNVNIYDSETLKRVDRVATIHTNNIFYAKDLPGTEMDMMITCAADGRVAVTNMTTKSARKLYRHRGRAHRIGLVPYESNQFYSCGEDGACCLFDLRDGARELFQETEGTSGLAENVATPVMTTHFKNNRGKISSIYTVGVNPLNNCQVAVAGSSNHIALYDSRQFSEPVSYLCPQNLASSSAHVTGLKYDHTGQMLIGSYNDEDVYSFFIGENALPERRTVDANRGAAGAESEVTEASRGSSPAEVAARGYYHKYFGHRNNNTVKQVGFMGGRSDFVISGSDCGHIFMWDTHTAELVQMLKADSVGAINCLASHPYLPILATSGLENDAKIWAPIGEHKPLVEGSAKRRTADQVVSNNTDRSGADTTYPNSLLRLLLSLMNRGDLPLHDDYHEADSDGSEGSENSDRSGDGENMSEDGSVGDDDDGGSEEMRDSPEHEDDTGDGSDGDAGARAATATSRRNRWTRRSHSPAPGGGVDTQAAARAGRGHRGHHARSGRAERVSESPAAGESGEDGDGDSADPAGGQHGRDSDSSPQAESSSSESGMEEDVASNMVSADDLASGRVAIMIDGVEVPWSQLMRMLGVPAPAPAPARLGRRRRSPSDTGDEAKEQDSQERRSSQASQDSQGSQGLSQEAGEQPVDEDEVPELEVDPEATSEELAEH